MMEGGAADKTAAFSLALIAALAACAVCKLMSAVLIPVVVAVLLSLVLDPVVTFFSKVLRLPRIVAVVFLMLFLIAAIVLAGHLFYIPLRNLSDKYSLYESKFASIYNYFADKLSMPYNDDISLLRNLLEQGTIRSFVANCATKFSGSVLNFGKTVTLVLLFIFFFLQEMAVFRRKLHLIFPDFPQKSAEQASNSREKGFFAALFRKSSDRRGDAEKLKNVSQKGDIVLEIISKVSKYAFVKFAVSLLTGFLVFALLFAIGLDYAFLWGGLAFFLNFIPNFGSIFSGVVTSLFAVAQFWGDAHFAGRVFAVAVVMLGVNMFLGNIVEPKWQGDNLGLSAFSVLVSLSVWGYLWGFAGLILAVPLTSILRIVCCYVPNMKFIAVLLSNEKSLLQIK